MALEQLVVGTEPSKTLEKRVAQEDSANLSPKRVKSPAAKVVKPHLNVPRQRSRASTVEPILNTASTIKLEIFVFGDGSSGELGLGTRDAVNVETPRLNSNLDAKSVGVVDIATGGMHAVALTRDNKVFTWGLNDLYTLGRDTFWDGGMRDNGSGPDLNPLESTPTAIPTDKFPTGIQIVQVAAGDSTTFVLTEEGLVYGWGTFCDSSGILGFSLQSNKKVISVQREEPLRIPNLKRITQISVGNDFCLALDANGNVYAWGNGEQSQIGRRLIKRHRDAALVPTRIALPRKKIVSIHAGADHAFAIDSDGNTWSWGSNNFGQTGIDDDADQGGGHIIAPRKVKSLIGKNMKMIQGGSHHSIGITHAGECLVWGRIDGAQMGLDTSELPLDDPEKVIVDRGIPRILLQPTPLPLSGCIYAAAGSDHNIVITSDGKAYSWGFNVNYQCGQGHDDDIPIATLISDSEISCKKLCWAGAGGQYSMLASAYKDVSTAK